MILHFYFLTYRMEKVLRLVKKPMSRFFADISDLKSSEPQSDVSYAMDKFDM